MQYHGYVDEAPPRIKLVLLVEVVVVLSELPLDSVRHRFHVCVLPVAPLLLVWRLEYFDCEVGEFSWFFYTLAVSMRLS